MISRKMLTHFFSMLILALLASGCSSFTFRVEVQRPSEIDMTAYKTVAVIPIEDDTEDILLKAMQGKIVQDASVDVIDQRRIMALMEEQNWTSSERFSSENASKLGQLASADAVIIAEFGTRQLEQPIERIENFVAEGEEPSYSWKRILIMKLTLTLQVLDVATGKILAQKDYPASIRRETDLYDSEDIPMFPEDQMRAAYTQCATAIANRFSGTISSTTQLVNVTIEKFEHPNFDRALTFAKQGRWDNAVEEFGVMQQFAKSAPEIDNTAAATAYYNYGVALQYSGQITKGIAFLEEAYKSNPKGLYNNQIGKAKYDLEQNQVQADRDQKAEDLEDIQ